MDHYCRRFQEAMLPHIPNLGSPEMQALQLLRNGLPPEVKEFVQAPMVGMTLENMINDIMEAELTAHMLQADALVNDHGQVPVDDVGIEEPSFHWDPLLPEDPIPAMPLQEIPPQEAEVGANANDMDFEDFLNNPEPPENPPVINIKSDDEEDVEEDIEDIEDDLEEILFGDEDWDVLFDVPEVRQEVPLAPAELQRNPPLVREDLLYERFRRMKAPEFEGLTDPIEADNWLIDIQMTVQMRRDVANMSWQDFVAEFRTMYYNREILAAQQDEFTSFKQELVPNETEKVRRMMKMFRTDITKQVSVESGPPTLVADCISRALRADYWINQDKKARAQIFKVKKEEKAVVKPIQPQQNSELYPKAQTSNSAQSSKQFGRNKRKGNFTGQGQQRNYPQKKNNRGN
ncbi:hypothetical protein TIFTF001_029690 [Ficus carica]|uniref:Gag protein n=1 Tax=Ficus carica TaxID=3494 RepID=A0AA88J1U5_FICCA|nr:hypothetical protein TIFTF001_029690 [Ficus carica]